MLHKTESNIEPSDTSDSSILKIHSESFNLTHFSLPFK